MSNGINNFMSIPGNWWIEHDYGAYVPTNSYWSNQTEPRLSRHIPLQATIHDGNRDDQGGQLMEERIITLPLGFPSFPLQPRSPLQLVFNSGMARGYSLGFMGQHYNPRGFMGQQSLQAFTSTEPDGSRLSQEEQNKALKKLKKEIYNPVPKRMTSRLSLYYRDRGMVEMPKERRKETEEEGKRCAVCLEDFEAKEWVMVTPCSHMFHEECIVPWVKSNGQCPVCRFTLYERARAGDLSEGDMLSVIRATGEAVGGNAMRW